MVKKYTTHKKHVLLSINNVTCAFGKPLCYKFNVNSNNKWNIETHAFRIGVNLGLQRISCNS